MSRRIPGLSQAAANNDQLEDGEYLVRVLRAYYHWDNRKPYYTVRFEVLEPRIHAQRSFTARIYCSAKALWKLNWFLEDFGYDVELLGRDELDEKALRDLTGIVKIANRVISGHSLLSLEAFAPASRWTETADHIDTEAA